MPHKEQNRPSSPVWAVQKGFENASDQDAAWTKSMERCRPGTYSCRLAGAQPTPQLYFLIL